MYKIQKFYIILHSSTYLVVRIRANSGTNSSTVHRQFVNNDQSHQTFWTTDEKFNYYKQLHAIITMILQISFTIAKETFWYILEKNIFAGSEEIMRGGASRAQRLGWIFQKRYASSNMCDILSKILKFLSYRNRSPRRSRSRSNLPSTTSSLLNRWHPSKRGSWKKGLICVRTS